MRDAGNLELSVGLRTRQSERQQRDSRGLKFCLCSVTAVPSHRPSGAHSDPTAQEAGLSWDFSPLGMSCGNSPSQLGFKSCCFSGCFEGRSLEFSAIYAHFDISVEDGWGLCWFLLHRADSHRSQSGCCIHLTVSKPPDPGEGSHV